VNYKRKWQLIATLGRSYRQFYGCDFREENGILLKQFLSGKSEAFLVDNDYVWNVFRYGRPSKSPEGEGRSSSVKGPINSWNGLLDVLQVQVLSTCVAISLGLPHGGF
jgi:hypothetical protein